MLAGLGAASESGVLRNCEKLPPLTTTAAVQGLTGKQAAKDSAAQLLNLGAEPNMPLSLPGGNMLTCLRPDGILGEHSGRIVCLPTDCHGGMQGNSNNMQTYIKSRACSV
jgi:hypothetical protein